MEREFFCCSFFSRFAPEYIKQFFVGLLDGDGSIVVDKVKKNIRVRFFISLKHSPDNFKMLLIIKEYVGGSVRVERKDMYVTWSATSKEDIKKVLSILDKYPLLTSRKQCQLTFALKYFDKAITKYSIDHFDLSRKNKYINQNDFLRTDPPTLGGASVLPFYFKGWFSGFVEAESHFKLTYRPTGGTSVARGAFCVGSFAFKAVDKYLLEMIKFFLESNHPTFKAKNKNPPNDFPGKLKLSEFSKSNLKIKSNLVHYKVSIYGEKSRQILINHFKLYPLLGDKNNSYIKWLAKNYIK